MTNYFLRTNRGYQDVVRVQDDETVYIPMDEANMDYQAYLAWVAEGNEAQPWE